MNFIRVSPIFKNFLINCPSNISPLFENIACPNQQYRLHIQKHFATYCVSPTFFFNLPFEEKDDKPNCDYANVLTRKFSPNIQAIASVKHFSSSNRLVVSLRDFNVSERVRKRTQYSWKKWEVSRKIDTKVLKPSDKYFEENIEIHIMNLKSRFRENTFVESVQLIKWLRNESHLRLFVVEENYKQVSSVIFIESPDTASAFMVSSSFDTSRPQQGNSSGIFALVRGMQHYKHLGFEILDLGTPAQEYKHRLSTHYYDTIEVCNLNPKLQAYIIHRLYVLFKQKVSLTKNISEGIYG